MEDLAIASPLSGAFILYSDEALPHCTNGRTMKKRRG